MEEKRYPEIDEEDSYGCMTAEKPSVAYGCNGATGHQVHL